MKKLYRFYWDYGRMGNVHGLFIMEEERVLAAIGKECYFGEILGKHSEVNGTLTIDDLTVLSEDQKFIQQFEEIVGTEFGYNPVECAEEFEKAQG